MRIPNEPESEIGGAFADLLRLQTEFHTRLTEETLKYLRRLQDAAMPTAPGTVLMPGEVAELQASGSPGTAVELKLEVENRQRVYCVVTPMLSQLVEASGITWFPAVEPSPETILLAPEEVATLVISLPLPDDIPAGVYRGALLLQGFRAGAITVTVSVANDMDEEAATHAQPPSTTINKDKARGIGNSSRSSSKKKASSRAKKGRRGSAKTR